MSQLPPARFEPEGAPEEKLPWFDVRAYLRRIGIEKPEPPSLSLLRKLHRQHLYQIPFENLDIHWGREILLDLQRVFNKIVTGQRGGFCYELNGLFCTLLLKLGFPAYPISVRILRDDNTLTPEFEHMAVLVENEGSIWLADVGFGKGFLSPIKIGAGEPQIDFNKFFRIKKEENGWWLQESDNGESFSSLYFFTPKRRTLVEFIGRCQFQQRDPASHFRKQKLISIASPEGRVTLTDRQLIVVERGVRTETSLLNEDDFYIKLEEYFGIRRPTD